MAGIEVKDIHHLGIVAGVVNDLKIVELVNQVLPSEEQDQMPAIPAILEYKEAKLQSRRKLQQVFCILTLS
jgi:hypothetical protein